MGKQYIPSIGGLLTEPNPVDAPSNTLTKAENIIIDQSGKAQARHGFNVNEDEATAPFTANSNEPIVNMISRTFIPPIVDPDNTVNDQLTNYVHYSSFFNQSSVFFKILEFRKSNQEILSGLFVKQRKKEYVTTQVGSNINYLYKNAATTDIVNRYYQISADSGKLIKMNELPYDDIKNVFATNLSLYLQTENGIADANVDDVFEPTTNRFFDIRWPAFPKISHTFIRSAIYANWFPANHKIGIRITFYREMGYGDKQEEIYESQPSNIYEIVNNGKDSIPVINLDLLSALDAQQYYKKWNEFSKLNNGRKFGIKIYRTNSVPVAQSLETEFYECIEPISFDKALSGKLEIGIESDRYEWFRFNAPGFSNTLLDSLDIGDIITYIPSFFDENGNSTTPRYSKDRIRFYSAQSIITDDLIPLKLKVTNRRLTLSNIYEYQFIALNDSPTFYKSTYIIKGNVLSRRYPVRILASNASANLVFINIAQSNAYHEYPVSTITSPSTIRFIDTPPTPFVVGVDYHVKSVTYLSGQPNIQLSSTIGGAAIVVNESSYDSFTNRTIEISPHMYIDNTYFTRSYEIELNLNDEALADIGAPLYTNPNSDSEFYTNSVAPDCEFIAPFKDFYVYTGVKKPLEARLSVITQPTVEQHTCVPFIDKSTNRFYKSALITFNQSNPTFTLTGIGLTNGNAVYFTSAPPTPFKINTMYYVVNAAAYPGNTFQLSTTIGGSALTPDSGFTATMNYQRWPNETGFALDKNTIWSASPTLLSYGNSTESRQINGELYVESAILGPRRYQVSDFPATGSYSFANVPKPSPFYNLMSFASLPDILNHTITNSVKATQNIDSYSLSERTSFNLTLFERPYLTLRLTSINNEVNDIVIQTEPLYNRRGYYSLKNEYDEYDDQGLTFDLSFDEMNVYRKSSTNSILRYGLDNIYHIVGEKEGQVSADGTYNATAEKWINDATGDIYYNKDGNTLLIKNAGNFDIKKFEAPGIIMIQSNETDIILFTYSSIETSQSIANSYTFKSVAIQLISRNRTGQSFIYDPTKLNQEIVTNANYFKVKGLTYFFFLKGTTLDGLDLFPYAKDIRIDQSSGISIDITATKTNITETYTSAVETATNPTFTLLPHGKMSDIPVGFFNRNKNYRFLGLNRKDAGEYLDLYSWQIINKFNVELQKRNIKASLTKGEGIGEIIITYPDGKSIKMMNGLYDSVFPVYYPGNHTFLPALNKLEFVELAKREEYDMVENNQVAISRRMIPEITPIGSVATIGKADKKFIGYGANADDLYIFKEDGIFRIFDRGNISALSNIPVTSVTQVSTNIICQAAGSIKEINDEIIFLSQYGFISINNGSIVNISESIQRDILTLIQISPKDRIKSFVNESKQLYYCTLINEVDSSLEVKSGTYIFNTKTRQWSFMDQEILDGLEDSQKRNLVAYRQKAILGTYNGITSWSADSSTHKLVSCDLTYPMQTTEFVNNFYTLSRERHTNNIMFNPIDQYDYISENMLSAGTFTQITNGFTVTIPVSQNAFLFHYAQKLFKMFTPPTTINITGNQYAIVDSPIQILSNREIFVEMIQTAQTTKEYYQVKLTKFEYLNTVNYRIRYTFEYLTTNIPTNGVSLQSLKVLAGIPVKMIFNPESGNAPDTNKLFQEYMIHTETSNKGATMNFKTDSRSTFTIDRRFVYDTATTNRNIFRTYIPMNASRGRYLIRQVKHDVPLENLIITGQTIVMKDSGSTRVQKDKDNE